MRPQPAAVARLLFEASRALLVFQDLPATLRIIAAKTSELLGATHAQILLWDEAAQTLSLGAADGSNVGVCDRLQYGLGRGVSGVVASTRQSLIVNNYQHWPHRFADLSDVVAGIGVPLFAHGRFLGVLASCSIVPGIQFEPHHIQLLETFAALAAMAIGNARLHDAAAQELAARRQAETELRESEAKYRIVADNTYDWEFWRRSDGVFLYNSPSCLRITGYTAAEFAADPDLLLKIIHPDDQRRLGRDHWDMAEHITNEVEFRVLRPDGTERWIGHVCQPVYDDAGRFLGRRGSNRDITERKRTEAALREGEILYQALFEQTSVGVAQLDTPTGRFVRINPRYCEIVGYTTEEMLATDFQSITHPDDLQTDLNHMRQLVTGEIQRFSIEKRYCHKNGSVVWVSLMVLPLWAPGTTSDYHIAVIEDITARKQTDQALRESEEKFAKAFRHAPVLISITDLASGVYLEVNEEALRVSGFTREEIAGRTATELGWITAEERSRLVQELQTHGRIVGLEMTFRTKSGARLDGVVNGEQIMIGGKPCLLTISIDMTARKMIERALLANKERYRRLFEEAIEGIVLTDADSGAIIDCNAAFERLSGYSRAELIGRQQRNLHPVEKGTSAATGDFAMHRESHEWQILGSSVVTKSGTAKQVEIKAHTLSLDGRHVVQGFFRDMTEEARYRRERETTLQLLRLLNDQNHTHDLIREVTRLLQEWTGCEAVGVRLRDGDDFPYYETRGFPAEFILLENQLCLRDAAGQVVRDTSGKPALECMCGNILCGRFDPSLPFFTPKGSFCSNNTTALLASTSEADRQARTRNRCNGEGYESVALIALRHAGQTLGLLQLNDHAAGRFTPELLGFLENAADQIAIALAQRQAQVGLQESEERFRTLAALAPAGIYLTAPDGKCQYANPRWREMAGLSLEETLGDGWVQGLHPEDRASVVANWQRMVSSEGHWGLEYRFQTRDGLTTWVYGLAAPQRDASGRILRYIGLNLDITDRKRAEEALHKNQAELQAIHDNAPFMICLLDQDHRLIYANRALVEYVGLPMDSLQFQRACGFLECINAMEGPRGCSFGSSYQTCGLRLAMLDTIQTGTPHRGIEHRTRIRRNGQECDVVLLGSTAPIQAGGNRRLLLCLDDITERKHAEEARALLSSAVEQTGECVVITDTDGTIQYVNPAFERITGYVPTEVIGQKPSILKSGKQDPGFYETLWKTITQGDAWTGTFINRRKDGSLYEERAVISPIRDAAGAIINFVAVKRDVTHERELETQLQQAQKLEAVGRLAGGIAHDFNNLLFLILGSSRVLLEERPDLDPLVQELLEDIQAAGNRAAELTDQLLAFSRKQARQPRLLDLNVAVSRVEKMLRRIVGEPIHIVVALAPDPLPVHADPGQLEQVLVNLAANARDAMPHGGTLTIEAALLPGTPDAPHGASTPRAAQDPSILLRVRDTGTGMDAETLARLFEPFFTTKGQGKGAGLGLSTVHGIVEQNGWTIQVESGVGRGTTFTISLPRAESPAPDAAAAPAPAPAVPGSETILLVEDQTPVRNLASRMLRRQGYTVLEAGGGAEALLLAGRHTGRIHLLLTDIVMPEMRGPELAAQLTARRPDLRVLYMSGHPGESLESLESLDTAALAAQLLHKPFTPADLARHVRQALDHSQAAAAL